MSSTQVNAALALLKKILPDTDREKEKQKGALSHEEALAELE